MNPALARGVVTPDVRDVLVRNEDGRWWIDNGFGVNALKCYFATSLEAVQVARVAVSPWGGRVLVETDQHWEVVESPQAAVRLDLFGRHHVA